MIQKLYKGQVVSLLKGNKLGNGGVGLVLMPTDLQIDDRVGVPYYVYSPFVQFCFLENVIPHLNHANLIQNISKNKFLNCIYRDGSEDLDRGVFISEKFGKLPVVINRERTHCYFSYDGKFWKSKVWVDKVGAIYGACAGSQYGEYYGKL